MVTIEQVLIILIVLWLFGLLGGIGGDLIHFLLVLAAAIFILKLLGVVVFAKIKMINAVKSSI